MGKIKNTISKIMPEAIKSPIRKAIRKAMPDRHKINYGKAVMENGTLPRDFSINLGAAYCNHSCLFCPQSVEKPEKSEWLDLVVLEKVLSEIPEKNIRLNISSYSETIAAPNLLDAVKLMKQIRPNLPISMASNGTLFRENVIEQLMDLKLDHYQYSFDGATRESYAKLMQKDDFEKVWNNLESLVEMKKKKGSGMMITTHIMGFKGEEKGFEKFKEYWEGKVDRVDMRRVSNWGSDDLGLEKRLAKEGFISKHETPEKRMPCTSIFVHFKLGVEGHYYPCVAAIPAYGKHLVPALGDAREITFLEAWEKLAPMRRAHLEGRWDEYACCKTCNVWSMWDDMWYEKKAGTERSQFYLKEIEYDF